MPDIDICFAVDQKFGRYLHFALASVLLNAAPDDRLHFHILSHGVASADQDRIRDMVQAPATVDFVEFGYADFEQLPAGDNMGLSPAIYGRLLIPDFFPDLDRAIYLDSDVIVRGSLSALWNVDLAGCDLGAVAENPDPNCDNPRLKELGLSQESYFNSGVLLIDCRKWRQQNSYQQLLEIGKKYNLRFPDQDMLNIAFAGRVKNLDRSWNSMTTALNLDSARIVHYFFNKKPWDSLLVNHPQYFWDVALRLADSREILRAVAEELPSLTTFKMSLLSLKYNALILLGYKKERYQLRKISQQEIKRLLPVLRKFFQN